MNIDTDTQWAYWDGIRMFYKKNEEYLQGQVWNFRFCLFFEYLLVYEVWRKVFELLFKVLLNLGNLSGKFTFIYTWYLFLRFLLIFLSRLGIHREKTNPTRSFTIPEFGFVLLRRAWLRELTSPLRTWTERMFSGIPGPNFNNEDSVIILIPWSDVENFD